MAVMQCYKEITATLAAASAVNFIKDDQGKISHIVAFLYHTGLNKNGVEITEAIGDLSAPGFNGLDFIATPNLDHDVFMDDTMPGGGVFSLIKPVEEYRQASKNFSLGQIVNTNKVKIAVGNAKIPAWRAIIKLTNEKFRDKLTELANKYKDIKKAKLYVSSFFVGRPKILASGNGKQKYVYDSPVTAIHLALVKSPAFDDNVSLISGICAGDDVKCSQELAVAASYEKEDSLVNDFNNQLLEFTKMLYASGSSVTGMAEEPKEQNDKAPIKSTGKDDKETKTQDNAKLVELENTVLELKKQLEEQAKAKEGPKEEAKDKDKPEESELEKKVREQDEMIKQLQRKEAVNAYLEKLKLIPGLDIKVAKKQAELFVDKQFTNKEVDEFINNYAPMIKASASSNDEPKERPLDASMLNSYVASASNYDPATATDEQKKERNRAINFGVIDFLLPFINK